MTELASLKATVRGRVHGVFFRAFVHKRADELNLSGYARNMPDGTVEVRAEGEKQQLEKLVGHLRVGPSAARVDEVLTNWAEYTGEYKGFRVRY
jgi:acylphosphatase